MRLNKRILILSPLLLVIFLVIQLPAGSAAWVFNPLMSNNVPGDFQDCTSQGFKTFNVNGQSVSISYNQSIANFRLWQFSIVVNGSQANWWGKFTRPQFDSFYLVNGYGFQLRVDMQANIFGPMTIDTHLRWLAPGGYESAWINMPDNQSENTASFASTYWNVAIWKYANGSVGAGIGRSGLGYFNNPLFRLITIPTIVNSSRFTYMTLWNGLPSNYFNNTLLQWVGSKDGDNWVANQRYIEQVLNGTTGLTLPPLQPGQPFTNPDNIPSGTVITPPTIAVPSSPLAMVVTIGFPGMIAGSIGWAFWKVGDKMGEHGTAGFAIGGYIGLVVLYTVNLVPMWFLMLITFVGAIGVYLYMKG